MESSITVTIPNQPFDLFKYYKMINTRCYLEEALDNAGYEGSMVYDFGNTLIDNKWYAPTEHFSKVTVEKAFNEGKDITVTLILIAE